MKKLILTIFMCLFLINLVSAAGIDWDDGTLVAYYDFTTKSNTTAIDLHSGQFGGTLQNITDDGYISEGFIGQGLYMNGSGFFNITNASNFNTPNFTVSFWMNSTDVINSYPAIMGKENNTGGGREGFKLEKGTGSNRYDFLVGDGTNYDFVTGEEATQGKFQHFILMYNGTSIVYYQNGTLTAVKSAPHTAANDTGLTIGVTGDVSSRPDFNRYFNGTIDEIGFWNRTLTNAEIALLWNSSNGAVYDGVGLGAVGAISVTLTQPVDSAAESSIPIIFNASITPAVLNITNATLYIYNSSDDIHNITFNIVTGEILNRTNWTIYNFSVGEEYQWNVYACGDDATDTAVCAWASSNFTFTGSSFNTIYTQYNFSLFETSRETFKVNISSNPTISAASTSLWYNGTEYPSIVIDGTAGIYSAFNSLDIHLAESDGNKTFYWQWAFELISGTTTKQNSTVYSHEVNRTRLVYCNPTYTTKFLNITSHTSANPFPHVNATLKSAIQHWLGTGEVKRNYSFEDITETNHTFNYCGSVNKTFYIDASFEYDSTGYAQNYHYFSNASLSNESTALELYLLNDSFATLTVLKVTDEAQNAMGEVLIQIQLYDIGTDTYYTVGMAKTSFAGEDIAYLNWYDTFYKFVLTRDGEVLKITSPYKIAETPQVFEITTSVTFPYDKFGDIIYNLGFNNATKNFVLIFVMPTGDITSGCLKVIKRNPTNDTIICDVCETSSSATLYCNVNTQGNGTFYATFYATGSRDTIETIIARIGGNLNPIFDLLGEVDGTAYAIIFAGIVLSLFFVSPIFAIIGIILGMLGAMVMGFQPLEIGAFIGIVIAGGFMIWVLRK